MLRKILVAIGVSVMVLGGVLLVHGDDKDDRDDKGKNGTKKQHQAILNAVNSGSAQHGQLSNVITALSGGHQAILDAVNRGIGDILATEQGILAKLVNLDDIRVKLDGLLVQGERVENICTAPDLVPLPAPAVPQNTVGGSTDFCRIDAQGKLHVLVHNQGGKEAGASQTQLFFRVPQVLPGQISCGGQCARVDAATPVLTGFSGIDLAFDIPEGCFGIFGPDDRGHCSFKIAVDGTSAVTNESNELNNGASGGCSILL